MRTFALKLATSALAACALATTAAAQQEDAKRKPHRVNNCALISIDREAGVLKAKTPQAKEVPSGEFTAKLTKNVSAPGVAQATWADIEDGDTVNVVGKVAPDKSSVKVDRVIVPFADRKTKHEIDDQRVTGIAHKNGKQLSIEVNGKTLRADTDEKTQFYKQISYDLEDLNPGARINVVGYKIGDEFHCLHVWVHSNPEKK